MRLWLPLLLRVPQVARRGIGSMQSSRQWRACSIIPQTLLGRLPDSRLLWRGKSCPGYSAIPTPFVIASKSDSGRVAVSDQRLRDLERRWKETGAPRDEAALLLERVRVGDLEQSSLEIAGLAGWVGAELAQEHVRAQPIGERMLALGNFGQLASVRVAHAAASRVLPLWLERLGDDDRPFEANAFVGEWILCPCEDHLAQVLVQAGNAEVAGNGVGEPDQLAAWAVGESAYAMTTSPDALSRALVFAVAALAGKADWRGLPPASFLGRESAASKLILAAIAKDLGPWALGYSDPVRQRVLGRQQ